MTKYFILTTIGEIIYLSSMLVVLVTDKRYFLACVVIGTILAHKYSLKIRALGRKKNLYITSLITIIFLILYILFFNKYKIPFFSFEGIAGLIAILGYVYVEYTFYAYPLEKLNRMYKQWK